MGFVVGLDIGGTLTDLVAFDTENGELHAEIRSPIQSDLAGFDVEGDAIVWLGD